jgi:hypothetical protein
MMVTLLRPLGEGWGEELEKRARRTLTPALSQGRGSQCVFLVMTDLSLPCFSINLRRTRISD